MKKLPLKSEIYILLACFILSRIIIKLFGLSFGYHALISYWQYLDIDSLKHNLLNSLWYQHSQPPVFNFILGIILKCSGSNAPAVFEGLLLLISFVNACLLHRLLKKLTDAPFLPLITSLIYLLSPATILFEKELFYTSFISLLLLLTAYFIIEFQKRQSWLQVTGLFSVLTLLSLTKGLYHLSWLCVIISFFIIAWGNKKAFAKIAAGAFLSMLIVTGWYVKNYFLFGSFSASSWSGINFARIVFHEVEIKDSTNIASVYPFLPIRFYNNHVSADYKKTFAGLNDKVLLEETKNDSVINLNNAGYLQVSEKYMSAGLKYVKTHPVSYIKNAATSFIIFFTPASSYFRVQDNSYKIRYYDLLYSGNLSHFITNEKSRKLSLALAAIPKFCLYLAVFFVLIRYALGKKLLSAINGFAGLTILFVLAVSTLFEYGENMRFRYEVEPLFLMIAAQVLVHPLLKAVSYPGLKA